MLIYSSKCTRPDVAVAVHIAERKSENPNFSDWNKIINNLKYLNTTKNYKLHYNRKGELIEYVDSDFGGDIIGRKTTLS